MFTIICTDQSVYDIKVPQEQMVPYAFESLSQYFYVDGLRSAISNDTMSFLPVNVFPYYSAANSKSFGAWLLE